MAYNNKNYVVICYKKYIKTDYILYYVIALSYNDKRNIDLHLYSLYCVELNSLYIAK